MNGIIIGLIFMILHRKSLVLINKIINYQNFKTNLQYLKDFLIRKCTNIKYNNKIIHR
jgi:hypothetical protein